MITRDNLIQKLHLHQPEETAAVCMVAIQEIERLKAELVEARNLIGQLGQD